MNDSTKVGNIVYNAIYAIDAVNSIYKIDLTEIKKLFPNLNKHASSEYANLKNATVAFNATNAIYAVSSKFNLLSKDSNKSNITIQPKPKIMRKFNPKFAKDMPGENDILRFNSKATIPAYCNLTKRWKIDNVPKYVRSMDQGEIGSCTANVYAAQYELLCVKEKAEGKNSKPLFRVSRLALYYNARILEGSADSDAGLIYMISGIVSMKKYGVCPEKYHPYDVAEVLTVPPTETYAIGLKHRARNAKAIIVGNSEDENALDNLKMCLSAGYSVAFGFDIFESFQSDEFAETGMMPMPELDEDGIPIEESLGGHAVLCVGYNDELEIGNSKGAIIVKNSWGRDWGKTGHFFMPYEFLTGSYNALVDDELVSTRYVAGFWALLDADY
jgi:C1A family cysteine protease